MTNDNRITKHTLYRRAAFFLLAFLTVAALSTGSVYAYLKWESEKPVTNTFHAETSVQPVISETFENNVKTDVTVNVGETGYQVYVRAAVVANWVNASGQVCGIAPQEGTDYEVDWYEDESWFRNSTDGFYYYKYPVSSSGSTSVLIKECKPLKDSPEVGYTLQVSILAQTIQSAGTTDIGDEAAATDAWGMTVK